MLTTLDVPRLKSFLTARGCTQAELAEKSGVSRAQLSRLLAVKEARVRSSTLDRLAAALGTEPSRISAGGPLEGYRDWVSEQGAYVDFRGIGMPVLQRQPIEDVFVDVDVTDERPGEDDACQAAGGFARGRRREPLLATDCVSRHDRLIMLGGPGSGKTTLLRFLARTTAKQHETPELPLYIRLSELCRAKELDERVDPVGFVTAQAAAAGHGDLEELLRQELDSPKRRCLVLFDGLDEVGSDEQKRLLIDSVRSFVERYPRNRFVVTSRIIGFEPAPWRDQGFSILRMLRYGSKQLAAFAEKWSKILSRAQGKPQQRVLEQLQSAVFSNPRVRAIASNPLILTILVLLNESRGGTLPRRRVDLYEKVVNVFLETWESNKRGGKFDATYNIDLDAREFRWLLSDLSLAMQKAERTLAPRWWLAERMQEYLQQRLGFAAEKAKDVCDWIIRYLAERTGLIEERGLDLFGFSHRTLQEYFASLGVRDEAESSASRDVTAALRDYYFHPSWSEVVRLVAAQLTPPLAESLITSILDDPDPVGRFLHRAPLLALGCLADGTTVPNRRLLTEVFESMAELGKSKWLGITLSAIDVLESFEDTRLQDLARKTLSAIVETAGRELDADEHACLWQQTHVEEINVAAQDGSVRKRLLETVQGDGQAETRSGAARALRKAAETEPSIREVLLRIARDDREPEKVRISCGWSLEPQLGKSAAVTGLFTSWLNDSRVPQLQRVAAQSFARALAEERLDWDYQLVETVQAVLMDLVDPCPCALESLEQLANSREVRQGLRLENVLHDSLRPLADRIELAFVFGSTARNRQSQDSDIDLFLLGDVHLKALAGPLRRAELTLGRRISPVIYSRDSFKEKYQGGDPFLLEVCRREKVPLLLRSERTSREELDSELGTMGAERMAPAR